MDASILRLNQLGYFEEIKEEDAKVEQNPNEPKVNLTMKVQEKGRNTIGFNGGVSGIGGSFLGGTGACGFEGECATAGHSHGQASASGR